MLFDSNSTQQEGSITKIESLVDDEENKSEFSCHHRKGSVGNVEDEINLECKICCKYLLKTRNIHCTVNESELECKQFGTDDNKGRKLGKWKCDTCGKVLQCYSKLMRHIRIHTGCKPYTCASCDKEFRDKSSLRKHTRVHTGEKPYACTSCSKVFRDKSNLRKHSRTHTGEKTFICTLCSKDFSLKHHLTRHFKTHTGEKSFICTVCGKAFTRKEHLVGHLNTHPAEESSPMLIST